MKTKALFSCAPNAGYNMSAPNVLFTVSKLIIPNDFIVLDYATHDRVQIIFRSLLSAIREAYKDVTENTLKLRLNDEEKVFIMYKALNTPSHYKKLCMIIEIEVDKCGLDKCKPLITSSNTLIDLPKLTIKLEIEKLEGEPK